MHDADVALLLDEALAALEQADRTEDVQRIVRTAARQLAGADGATLVLREGEQCYYADEDAMSPLWKGQRFPLTDCISGWTMLNREVAVIPNIYVDPRIPQDAYRPTFVQSLAMVPIRVDDPLGAIGTYWAARHEATDEELARIHALATSAGKAIEKFVVAEPHAV